MRLDEQSVRERWAQLIADREIVVDRPCGSRKRVGRVRVLVALIELYEQRQCVLFSELAEHLGCSVAAVHHNLESLASLGLVDWTPGLHGTLRPLVRRVA